MSEQGIRAMSLKELEKVLLSGTIKAEFVAAELLRRHKEALSLLKTLNKGLHENELAGHFAHIHIRKLDDLVKDA